MFRKSINSTIDLLSNHPLSHKYESFYMFDADWVVLDQHVTYQCATRWRQSLNVSLRAHLQELVPFD